MFSTVVRCTRPALTGAALMACADARPTQPVDRVEGAAVVAPPSADIAPASPALPSVIYACYEAKKGTIYRIKTAETAQDCDKKDIAFNWSDRGDPGPQGAQGVQGPKGDTGPQGPTGAGPITGMTFNSLEVTLDQSGRHNVTCPAGKAVVAFGAEIAPLGDPTIFGSRPTFVAGSIGWGFHATPGSRWVFYWTCADAATQTVAP